MSYVVVTGGVRSGKSRMAEHLVGEQRRVLYVATGAVSDREMARRIELHQQRRSEHWELFEFVGEKLTEALQQKLESVGSEPYEGVLIDCLSTWVSTSMINLPETEWRSTEMRQRLHTEAERLAQWLQDVPWQAVVVTNETGLGGVAMSPLGRAFQDLLGEVNQIVAHQAQDLYLVVSGRALRLPNR